MSNGPTHIAASSLGVLGFVAIQEYLESGEVTSKPLAAGTLAALTAKLPDIIEPATNPNHRQFYHSLTFAAGLSYGMLKLYEWETEDDLEKLLRFASLAIGGSYLMHLLCDASTPKGLPII
ncbi:MAG: metal-dependent hydrolase [Proteobacteria bacterium]|nr:metal-dependent hydrolase [Pseudomonadota bacterium]